MNLRELDEKIARALGVKPMRVAFATSDGGESMHAWESPDGPFYSKSDIEELAAKRGYEVMVREDYPNYSSDWRALQVSRRSSGSAKRSGNSRRSGFAIYCFKSRSTGSWPTRL